jgi:hypothetical protein
MTAFTKVANKRGRIVDVSEEEKHNWLKLARTMDASNELSGVGRPPLEEQPWFAGMMDSDQVLFRAWLTPTLVTPLVVQADEPAPGPATAEQEAIPHVDADEPAPDEVDPTVEDTQAPEEN